MASSNAWILPLGGDLNAAVGEFEIVHIVHYPALFPVPDAPYYCNQVLVWQNQILPVLDLGAWLQGQASQRTHRLIAIASYAGADNDETHYAGLSVTNIPSQTVVDDAQACQLPNSPAGWHRFSVSCFKLNQAPVPIIDLETIFSDALMA